MSQTTTTDHTADGPGAADGARSTDERLAELERDIGRHDKGIGVILGLAFLVMIGSVIAIGLIQRNNDGGGAPAVAGQTITGELTEFAIELSADEVTPGSTINVTNTGSQVHTIGVEGTDIISPEIEPGGTYTLSLAGLGEGDYTVYCDIAGHVESGMSTGLTISEDAEPRPAAMPRRWG